MSWLFTLLGLLVGIQILNAEGEFVSIGEINKKYGAGFSSVEDIVGASNIEIIKKAVKVQAVLLGEWNGEGEKFNGRKTIGDFLDIDLVKAGSVLLEDKIGLEQLGIFRSQFALVYSDKEGGEVVIEVAPPSRQDGIKIWRILEVSTGRSVSVESEVVEFLTDVFAKLKKASR